jgi:hypothetical protein
VVAGAEAYYRNMFSREDVTWNIRDSHFMDTVTLVERHIRDMRARAMGEAAKEGGWVRNGLEGKWSVTPVWLVVTTYSCLVCSDALLNIGLFIAEGACMRPWCNRRLFSTNAH